MTTVVVTGLGATTPLGGDVASTWEAALAGRSGVRTLENDWAEKYGLEVTFAGQIAVRPEEVLTRPETKRMDPSAQLAIVATREAWADAGSPEVDPERLGVAVSSGIGGVWTLLDAWDTLREKGASRVLPMTVPMLMPNSPSAYVELEMGARAGAHAPVSACASGAEAIATGYAMIRSGPRRRGRGAGAPSPRPIPSASPPSTPCRRCPVATTTRRARRVPYDITRDGFVMGEGAGILVLETEEHAKARGAKVYARLAGVGLTSDAYHIAAPEPNGDGAGACHAPRARVRRTHDHGRRPHQRARDVDARGRHDRGAGHPRACWARMPTTCC